MADDSNFCSDPDIAYVSPGQRNAEEHDEKIMVLTPWTVQNICFETIRNYLLSNPPQEQGYKFSQRYDVDDLKTGIALEIAYNYKDIATQKRPAIFVTRGEAAFSFPSINQAIGINSRESEIHKYTMVQMPVILSVVATNVGFAEQLAEYIFQIFLRHQENIRNDFCLRQIKVAGVSAPQLYLESKDHFVVSIQLQITFDMGAVIKKDDLKLKVVAYNIFMNCLDTLFQSSKSN
jgi:hypothetical protein